MMAEDILSIPHFRQETETGKCVCFSRLLFFLFILSSPQPKWMVLPTYLFRVGSLPYLILMEVGSQTHPEKEGGH